MQIDYLTASQSKMNSLHPLSLSHTCVRTHNHRARDQVEKQIYEDRQNLKMKYKTQCSLPRPSRKNVLHFSNTTVVPHSLWRVTKYRIILVVWGPSLRIFVWFGWSGNKCVPTSFYTSFLNKKYGENKALVVPEPAACSSDRCQASRGKVGSPPLSDSYWASWAHREALPSGRTDAASDLTGLRRDRKMDG